MTLRARPKTAQTVYVRAPWHLRLRWWITAQLWCVGRSFKQISAEAPELSNPLWRR